MPNTLEEDRRRKRRRRDPLVDKGGPTINMSRDAAVSAEYPLHNPQDQAGTSSTAIAAVKHAQRAIAADKLVMDERQRQREQADQYAREDIAAKADAASGRAMDSIAAARETPTPSNTKAATDTLLSFPFEDKYFGGNPVDNSSRQTLNQIKGIKNALSSGSITLEEAAGKIEVYERQLEGTARRREARLAPARAVEYATAAEDSARIADERARADVADATAAKAAIEDRIAKIETGGEGANPNILTSLYGQLGDADRTLQSLRAAATEAGSAFATARENRLSSLAPPGGARVEFESGEVITRGPEPSGRALEQPGSDIRRELGDISATAAQARDDIQFDIESGIQPAEPTEEEKGRIRREITPKIKAAKTYAEKKELLAEMRARLKGETTPLMDSKARRRNIRLCWIPSPARWMICWILLSRTRQGRPSLRREG